MMSMSHTMSLLLQAFQSVSTLKPSLGEYDSSSSKTSTEINLFSITMRSNPILSIAKDLNQCLRIFTRRFFALVILIRISSKTQHVARRKGFILSLRIGFIFLVQVIQYR